LDVGSIPTASTNFIMNRPHFFYFIIFSLLIALSTPANTVHAVNRNERYSSDPNIIERPPQRGFWLRNPTVIVCEGSMVTETMVKKAMAWWNNRGFYFGKLLFHEDPEGKCDDDTPDEHIVIRKVTRKILTEMKKGTLAETHFYTNPTTLAINYVKIYMVETPIRLVLEHEFGHALGFYHYNKRGHLMHVKNSKGGWNDHGLYSTERRLMDLRGASSEQQKSQEK